MAVDDRDAWFKSDGGAAAVRMFEVQKVIQGLRNGEGVEENREGWKEHISLGRGGMKGRSAGYNYFFGRQSQDSDV